MLSAESIIGATGARVAEECGLIPGGFFGGGSQSTSGQTNSALVKHGTIREDGYCEYGTGQSFESGELSMLSARQFSPPAVGLRKW